MLTKKQKTINWILIVFLLILSVFFLFPVIWMIANSFKPDAAITADMNSLAAFIPPALNGNYFDAMMKLAKKYENNFSEITTIYGVWPTQKRKLYWKCLYRKIRLKIKGY